jgi:hydroxypyruvate isomerase
MSSAQRLLTFRVSVFLPSRDKSFAMPALRQSICRWCFPDIPLPKLASAARDFGYESIELIGPGEWTVVKEFGLTCAMSTAPGTLEGGLNQRETHAKLIPEYRHRIAQCAAAGIPSLIAFSGNRRGLSDEEGLEACAAALRQIVGDAEKAKVTLCVELLNSRVDHPDYQCDRTAWGVELCRRLGSERVKLLYDIYHMQIMEGDVIRTIQREHQWIGHYHTGGNPGRNEIDDAQELNYPAIMRAIKATGYTGFVGQEFLPKREPIRSLREEFALCDV